MGYTDIIIFTHLDKISQTALSVIGSHNFFDARLASFANFLVFTLRRNSAEISPAIKRWPKVNSDETTSIRLISVQNSRCLQLNFTVSNIRILLLEKFLTVIFEKFS